MKVNKIDELNILGSSREELESIVKEYYKSMKISEFAKNERAALSLEIYDMLLFYFSYYVLYSSVSSANLKYILKDKFLKIISEKQVPDDYLEQYATIFSDDLVNSLNEHANDSYEDGDNYFLSATRALILSENEANTIMNYVELQDAVKNGFTKKTWITKEDERVRLDHMLQNRKTIDINSYFILSDCAMLMPHDYVNGTAAQISNCRCSIKYS